MNLHDVSQRGRSFVVWMSAVLIAMAIMVSSHAAAKPDPKAEPQVFVAEVADELIEVLQQAVAAGPLSVNKVHEIVDEYVLPYVNFEKTTRLAAGKYWRQATPEQHKELAAAFRNTLIRTYSGALSRVDKGTAMKILPFRGDASADDVVVQSNVTEAANSSPVRVDYRLEKTPEGWKIYDINVENIWLIQNYRNQFGQEIERSGIDGLIKALNQRNTSS